MNNLQKGGEHQIPKLHELKGLNDFDQMFADMFADERREKDKTDAYLAKLMAEEQRKVAEDRLNSFIDELQRRREDLKKIKLLKEKL